MGTTGARSGNNYFAAFNDLVTDVTGEIQPNHVTRPSRRVTKWRRQMVSRPGDHQGLADSPSGSRTPTGRSSRRDTPARPGVNGAPAEPERPCGSSRSGRCPAAMAPLPPASARGLRPHLAWHSTIDGGQFEECPAPADPPICTMPRPLGLVRPECLNRPPVSADGSRHMPAVIVRGSPRIGRACAEASPISSQPSGPVDAMTTSVPVKPPHQPDQ